MIESPVQNKGFYLPKITQNGNKNGTKSTIYRRAIFRTN